MELHQGIPSPLESDWMANESVELCINWNTINPAPDEILELMSCSCAKKYFAGSCTCTDNSLP